MTEHTSAEREEPRTMEQAVEQKDIRSLDLVFDNNASMILRVDKTGSEHATLYVLKKNKYAWGQIGDVRMQSDGRWEAVLFQGVIDDWLVKTLKTRHDTRGEAIGKLLGQWLSTMAEVDE